jgi:hypothetical protein
VEYTDESNIEQECTTQDQIDEACINEGYRRYAQSHDTPFLTSPLVEDFGFLGQQNKIDEVLDGTYERPPRIG